MKDLVINDHGKIFVLSSDVAERFNKEHRTVYRKIQNLIKTQPEFGAANFGTTSYTTEQNKVHDCYEMTRDGFSMVAMSLTGKEAESWKVKYIMAFNQMEKALVSSLPAMRTVNELVKKQEDNKLSASLCASTLASYKKVKRVNQEDIDSAMRDVQKDLFD